MTRRTKLSELSVVSPEGKDLMSGTIFISYSKADKARRERVETHLMTLSQWGDGDAEAWSDERIDEGEIDLPHLPETSSTLFGHDAELDRLDGCWQDEGVRVVA